MNITNMKGYILFAFFLIFLSCNSNPTDSNLNNNDSSKITKLTNPGYGVIKINEIRNKEIQKPIDSLSFEYFLTLTNDFVEIPIYLVELFLPQGFYSNTDSYFGCYGSEDNFYIINDIYVVSVSISLYGVCSYVYLVTYNDSHKIISNLQVEDHCDRDNSAPSYSYSNHKIIADTIIEIVNVKTEPIDQTLISNNTIDDFFEIEERITEEYQYYILQKSGVFNRIYTTKFIDSNFIGSYRILNKEDLSILSKKELRLLRNEIFARKGFIFKSKELTNYFMKFDWYKPLYNDPNFILNTIEKYNIELIKSFEDI